jgi:hypothetical protein
MGISVRKIFTNKKLINRILRNILATNRARFALSGPVFRAIEMKNMSFVARKIN